MPTQAEYDAAFIAAGEAATAVIQENIAQVPEGFRPMVEQGIQTYWDTIQAAIRKISDAAVDGAEKARTPVA